MTTTESTKKAIKIKKQLSSREIWRAAFFSVITAYQETKSVVGSTGAIDYAQAVLDPGTNLQSVDGHCKPSLSDFLCDVELAAKKALNEEDYKFFVKYFVNANLEDFPNNERLRDQAKTVAENCGRRFIAHKIYPVKSYMQSKVVKINRGE